MWAEPEWRLSTLTIEKPSPVEPCTVGLPPELLQIIFWYATGLPRGLERSLWETTYVPFQDSGWNDSYEKRRTRERRAVWQVKNTVSLVSRQWYALAIEFLLEEIRIGPNFPSWDALAKYGHWVRRIELLPTPGPVTRLVDVLRHCPRVTVLSKPCSIDGYPNNFWSGINELGPDSLQHLTRIDWAADTSDPHGIVEQALRMLLVVAPNVRHLAATSILQPDPHNMIQTLGSLQTLRLPVRAMGEFLTLGSRVPYSPNLRHIVVNGAFLQSMRFLHRLVELLPSGVRRAPGWCYVQFFDTVVNVSNVSACGRDAEADQAYSVVCEPVWGVEGSHVVDEELLRTSRKCVSSGEEVVLHGDWRFTLTANVMETLKEDLFNRSCVCRFQDT
ncbi:hypothetical protein BDZ89DRAFT_1056534 [Hymenopellis radicata]|nr:hypothetical protein BDZ89DRAFT_1056534 [Hymenopellis radicata]